MCEWLAGPGLREDAEHLFHCPSPLVDAGAESSELGLAPAQTQAQREPSSAEETDRGRVLGKTQRMVQWSEDDPGPDLDGRGGGCDGTADHCEGRHVTVVDEMVLGGPDRGEAKTLRFNGD